jgi:hypothetical protein
MIAAKNGTMMTATTAMTTGRKVRGSGNSVDANQITSYTADHTFYLKLSQLYYFLNISYISQRFSELVSP